MRIRVQFSINVPEAMVPELAVKARRAGYQGDDREVVRQYVRDHASDTAWRTAQGRVA